eukprot:CAMPEP_0168538594 /NCGR_PEP_ID=MMETSP0405-20121227/21222_1 /TAXON_ID=498012 /ORGANISM="Trichosphaerium sp, Strain Am-I-7 wt" /LENGTH=251 /DNA_ID=CAMNT_0008567789 /DNA_START=586 /DNA_END=1338 /DNA_ORIENTATION=-
MLPMTEVVLKEIIGDGNYGIVYRGEWRAINVAVKMGINIAKDAYTEFLDEVSVMSAMRPHKHVTQLFGVILEQNHRGIVMEYYSRGSLDRYLFDLSTDMTLKYRLELLIGVARGMLHIHKEGFVHRDLAARNILLSDTGVPKISDFGLSRNLKLGTKGRTKALTGPIRWMAPESIGSGRIYSNASDAWMFSCVCFECLARKEPHEGSHDFLTLAEGIRDKGSHPKMPIETPVWLMELTLKCWSFNPEERLT